MVFLYLFIFVATVTAFIIFLTVRKVHHTLPPCIALPFARKLQPRVGQKLTA